MSLLYFTSIPSHSEQLSAGWADNKFKICWQRGSGLFCSFVEIDIYSQPAFRFTRIQNTQSNLHELSIHIGGWKVCPLIIWEKIERTGTALAELFVPWRTSCSPETLAFRYRGHTSNRRKSFLRSCPTPCIMVELDGENSSCILRFYPVFRLDNRSGNSEKGQKCIYSSTYWTFDQFRER